MGYGKVNSNIPAHELSLFLSTDLGLEFEDGILTNGSDLF